MERVAGFVLSPGEVAVGLDVFQTIFTILSSRQHSTRAGVVSQRSKHAVEFALRRAASLIHAGMEP